MLTLINFTIFHFMLQNSIFPSFLACSLMDLETNLVGGKAMWLDMFNT